MSTKVLPRGQEVLAILLLVAISISGVAIPSMNFNDTGISGQIAPMALAMEPEVLEKEIGQTVHFSAKIMNDGNVETVYIIVVLWCEYGTEEWDEAGIEDMVLNPDNYETMSVGGVTCAEWMAGKYFNVKFILYDAEYNVLDDAFIEKAWYVKEKVIQGKISGFWVE